uniref:Uncharacterized protein n=1 Tax=Trichobilharzia regenti TaxID=157069 RepID=A0AA85JK09_TRIRE|nr:unnamed protein product [Trichobilharzia regenti]
MFVLNNCVSSNYCNCWLILFVSGHSSTYNRQPEKGFRRTGVSPEILQSNSIEIRSASLCVLFVYMCGVSYRLVFFGFIVFTRCFRALLLLRNFVEIFVVITSEVVSSLLHS